MPAGRSAFTRPPKRRNRRRRSALLRGLVGVRSCVSWLSLRTKGRISLGTPFSQGDRLAGLQAPTRVSGQGPDQAFGIVLQPREHEGIRRAVPIKPRRLRMAPRDCSSGCSLSTQAELPLKTSRVFHHPGKYLSRRPGGRGRSGTLLRLVSQHTANLRAVQNPLARSRGRSPGANELHAPARWRYRACRCRRAVSGDDWRRSDARCG